MCSCRAHMQAPRKSYRLDLLNRKGSARVLIGLLVSKQPMTMAQFSDASGLSQAAATHLRRALEEGGLVTAQITYVKRGTLRVMSIQLTEVGALVATRLRAMDEELRKAGCQSPSE